MIREAVRGADKKISFVILSGGTKGKKERVSDSKRFLPPYNQRRKETRRSCIYNFPFFSLFPHFLSSRVQRRVKASEAPDDRRVEDNYLAENKAGRTPACFWSRV